MIIILTQKYNQHSLLFLYKYYKDSELYKYQENKFHL